MRCCRFGYKQWRCGVYVHDAESSGTARLSEFLQDLAGFFSFVGASAGYKNAPMPAFQWAANDPALATAMAEAMKDKNSWRQAKTAAHIFDMQPPLGKAGLALALEGAPGEEGVNVLLTGNTWPWRSALDAADIPGGYVEEANGTRTYVRMLTGVRVQEAEDARRLQHLFEEVLRNYPVLLRPLDDEERGNAAVTGAHAHLLSLRSIWER